MPASASPSADSPPPTALYRRDFRRTADVSPVSPRPAFVPAAAAARTRSLPTPAAVMCASRVQLAGCAKQYGLDHNETRTSAANLRGVYMECGGTEEAKQLTKEYKLDPL